jgi:ligand-binding sensor domain-containing protein/signal transduction histidine kinase
VEAQSNMPPPGDSALKQVHFNSQIVRVNVAHGEDIRFSRLSTNAGLSQTRVAEIVQDDRGFMWFGTQYGLNRYDGYKFKVFTPDASRPDGISGAYIYALFKDRDGTIWIGCGQYLDRLDPVTESFTHYRLEPATEKSPLATVVSISQDRAGILWLSTANGLYGLDPRTGRVARHYSHDPVNPLSLSNNNVRSAGEDRSGRFWVADGNSLEQLDRKTGNVKLRVALDSSPREFSFYEDSSGLLWISGGPELASLDPDSKELTRYSFYDDQSQKALTASVFAVLQDKDGVFWFGTQGAGLLRFDREHRTAICYRNHANDPQSLAEDRVIALNQDREGNIWVGMHANTPNFFSAKKPSFRPLMSEGLNPNSMGEHFVNFIFEDRGGVLWIATTGALLGIDRRTGKHRTYLPPGGLSNDIVAIAQDLSGTMWVGTIGHGLNRFDPDTGRFTAYLHDPAVSSSLSNDAVDHLLVDHTGKVWVGTWDGLNLFNPKTGRFVVHKRNWNGRAEAVYGLAEDKDGALWLGGTAGLQRFDPETGTFTGYQHRIDDPTSISDDRVIGVYIDQAGTIWATTHNGLNKLDRQSGTFTKYYARDGLPSNRLNCMEPDESGHLWISTTAGLSEFDPRTKIFKNYAVADGLPGMDLSGWSACAKSRTGEMYFGGFSGGTAFYPKKIADSTYAPPVVFTDFQVAGVSAGVGGGSPLKQSISYVKSVSLSHTQTTFSLEFAALSYSTQETDRYRYRLEPMDSTWHEVGSGQRLVTYNRLPAGEYKFRVQAATSHGPWSDPGASLGIKILPPWWNTSWFRSICVIVVLLSLYAAYSYRVAQIARQFEVRLEERVSERTRIARELHDTLLQSFQGLIFRLQAVGDLLPEGKAKDQLERSLERADQAIAEGRSTVYELRSSATTTNDLAEAIRTLGDELTTQDSAAFRLVVEGPVRALHPIVRDEIYRITCEGLRNAFGHARASHIETEIAYGERLFRLRIRDDGEGIPTDILEGGRLGHYGLPGMRERASQIGGKLDIWSRTRAGTEIELSIAAAIAYGTPQGGSLFRLFRRKAG